MNNRCRKHLQDLLEANHSCYVLITCQAPSEEGEMEVEMTYQGDLTLVSYLLQDAQILIDKKELEEVSSEEQSNSIQLTK